MELTAEQPTVLTPGSLPAGRTIAVPDTGRVDLWMMRPSQYSAGLRAASAVLDENERARYHALVRQADRDRYATAHIVLRLLLGAYLGTEPARVVLARDACPVCGGPHGRPVVAGGGPHFSLSHGGDMVLVAIASDPVGVDVEQLPETAVVDRLLGTLHPRETAELTALEPKDRRTGFGRCWSRKEAYLKGTGTGLARGVDGVYVGTGPEPRAPYGWDLADVPVGPGYTAAVALQTAQRSPFGQVASGVSAGG